MLLQDFREYTNKPREHIKKQRHNFTNKDIILPSSQSYGFSSSHVQMWGLDHKGGWMPKNWCFQIVRLEKTLESPLDCKEIKAINLKWNWPWVFIGKTGAEAEAPILWPPDAKTDSLQKTLMLGKIEGKRRSGWQRVRWLNSITSSMGKNLSKLWEIVGDIGDWHATIHGVKKSQTQLSNWATYKAAHIPTYVIHHIHNVFSLLQERITENGEK